jgi:hypothetical protein
MAQPSELIRREIEETRADLDERLARLTEKAERAADVGGHLGARPWTTVATGAAVGFILGLRGSDFRSPHNGTVAPAVHAEPGGGPVLASRLVAHFLSPALNVLASATMVSLAGLIRDAVGHDAGPRLGPAQRRNGS